MHVTYRVEVVGMNYVVRRSDGTIHSAYVTRGKAERACESLMIARKLFLAQQERAAVRASVERDTLAILPTYMDRGC